MFKKLLFSKPLFISLFLLSISFAGHSQNKINQTQDIGKEQPGKDFLPGHSPKEIKTLYLSLLKEQKLFTELFKGARFDVSEANTKLFQLKVINSTNTFIQISEKDILTMCNENPDSMRIFLGRLSRFNKKTQSHK
tara:strand:+ start:479 stop:886 length:408 start_codon:yes stop_codon:yes gene_type:complete